MRCALILPIMRSRKFLRENRIDDGEHRQKSEISEGRKEGKLYETIYRLRQFRLTWHLIRAPRRPLFRICYVF